MAMEHRRTQAEKLFTTIKNALSVEERMKALAEIEQLLVASEWVAAFADPSCPAAKIHQMATDHLAYREYAPVVWTMIGKEPVRAHVIKPGDVLYFLRGDLSVNSGMVQTLYLSVYADAMKWVANMAPYGCALALDKAGTSAEAVVAAEKARRQGKLT